MLHLPPLVHVEQDAKNDDLYNLLEGGGVRQIINADSISSNVAQKMKIRIALELFFYRPSYLWNYVLYAGSERRTLIETNDRGGKMKLIAGF